MSTASKSKSIKTRSGDSSSSPIAIVRSPTKRVVVTPKKYMDNGFNDIDNVVNVRKSTIKSKSKSENEFDTDAYKLKRTGGITAPVHTSFASLGSLAPSDSSSDIIASIPPMSIAALLAADQCTSIIDDFEVISDDADDANIIMELDEVLKAAATIVSMSHSGMM